MSDNQNHCRKISDLLGLNSRTTRRALLWIVVIGLIGSFMLTAYQFFRDKELRIDQLDREMKALGLVFSDALSHSLWVVDTDLLETQLQGVAQLKQVSGVSLKAQETLEYHFGSTQPKDGQLSYSFPIHYHQHDETYELGTLLIYHDLQEDIDEIFASQMFNFMGNSLVILLIAISVSLIFQVFVVRRLMSIVNELNNLSATDMRSLPQGPKLSDISDDWDELDVLANSVTSLRQKGYELLQEADRKEEVMRNQNVELMQSLKNERHMRNQHRTFVTMVSHEFRTPLAVIDNIAQGVIRRQAKMTPETVEKRMIKVRTSINRLTALMESVLVADRMEEGAIKLALEKVDLRELISAIIETQRRFVTHRLNCEYRALPERIDGDAQMLRLVFENLVVNACKYSPDGKDIDITVWTEMDHVYVSIRDYGIGIPKRDRNRMFERFFRASNVTGISGSGIGLNTAQNIIELHGGKITLDSQEGVGTIFTISLPMESSGVNGVIA
ncbi:ATP-binding protein [Terasakiella sp. SH-1]|uniref:sensor histidine kinase n=1 Tax=Terasakiella sp. SH-1 TaxID=2560057 RepID=UPI00142F950B|nr:ATP-binding protein [Terasakiella sp. SH-1]